MKIRGGVAVVINGSVQQAVKLGLERVHIPKELTVTGGSPLVRVIAQAKHG